MILNSAEDIIYNGVHAQSLWYNGIEVWPITHTAFALSGRYSNASISAGFSAYNAAGVPFYVKTLSTSNFTVNLPYGSLIEYQVRSPLYTDPELVGTGYQSISTRSTASSVTTSWAERIYTFNMPKRDLALTASSQPNDFIVSGSGEVPDNLKSYSVFYSPVNITYVSARNAYPSEISAASLESGMLKRYETSKSSYLTYDTTSLKHPFYASACHLYVSGYVSAYSEPAYKRKLTATYFFEPYYATTKTANTVIDGEATTGEITYTYSSNNDVWNISSATSRSAMFRVGHALGCSANGSGTTRMYHQVIWSATGALK